jgi:acyl-coenzyme A thioesterase PaaI-like protein
MCHRGIILTLLDSAMVHTLLQRNISGLTAKLSVRFLKPIPIGECVEISAQIVDRQRELYYMTGTVFSGETVYAVGSATFFADVRSVEPEDSFSSTLDQGQG